MENMRRNNNRRQQSVRKKRRRMIRQVLLFALCVCVLGLILLMAVWSSKSGSDGDIAEDESEAVEYTVSVADKSSLQRLIDHSAEIDVAKYSSDSVKDMMESLQDAKNVVSAEATSKEIAQAYFNLTDAINHLKKK